jgi:hypothetical protein
VVAELKPNAKHRSRRADAACVALLALLPLLLIGDGLLPGRVVSTAGLERKAPWRVTSTPAELALQQMNADLVREKFSFEPFARAALRDGNIPWWSPYLYGGMPFVALSRTEALYPPAWLAAQLPRGPAHGASLAFHLFVAGVGMFVCLRAAHVTRAGALLGALAFSLNGMFATRHGHPQFLATGSWLPWMLAGVHLLCASAWGRGISVIAAASALAILAGHPSIYLYGFSFVGVYTLLALGFGVSGWSMRTKTALAFALAVAIGLGLSSGQLLATSELAAFSERRDRSIENLVALMPHVAHFLRAFVPDAFGNPLSGNYWSPSPTSYTAGTFYMGIVPLLLAGIGAVRGGWRGAALAGLAVLTLAVIFVPFCYATAAALLPVFRATRIDRLSIAYMLCISMLAALGTERVIAASARARRVLAGRGLFFLAALGAGLVLSVLWGVPGIAASVRGAVVDASAQRLSVAWAAGLWGATLLVLALAGRRSATRWLAPVLLALVIVDLFGFARGFVVVRDAQRMFRDSPAIRMLSEAEPPFRIAKFDPGAGMGSGPDRFSLFPANTPGAYGIEDLHGYGPLGPPYARILVGAVEPASVRSQWRIQPFQSPVSLMSPVLDLMNARYVVASEPVRVPGLELVHEGDLWIYENRGVLPRAFFVRHAEVEPDDRIAAARLARGLVDPRSLVLLPHPPAKPPKPNLQPKVQTQGGANEVEIVERDLSSVTLVKTGPANGYVLLGEAFYPGWEASVDGEPAEVLRANVMFRAVVVGAGKHTVKFVYRPTFASASAALTIAAALAWVIVVAVFARPIFRTLDGS